ncbi:MAG: CpsD/CapB family tyrosine-protein kinase, partial [Deltaproteobacteria bacterium]|nr:CpsD/CapB family tyrosine-protein kinase [Deltaproteobacteria bacterium]
PFLGIAPEVKSAGREAKEVISLPDLYIIKHPRSSAAECVRLVRTNLLFANPGGEVSRLVISSASPREGKTHTALNIAISMAQSGKKTLLVDSDMRRPRLHKVFGQDNSTGLSTLTVGKAEPDEAICPTEVENLFFLPCGPLPPNPAELLQTEQLKKMLQALGERFERMIFDSPPIMAVADPLILSQLTDGVILVVRSGVSTRDVVFRSVQALRDVNAHVLGAVLNGVDLTKPYYGRYYHYYRRSYTSGYHSNDEMARPAAAGNT